MPLSRLPHTPHITHTHPMPVPLPAIDDARLQPLVVDVVRGFLQRLGEFHRRVVVAALRLPAHLLGGDAVLLMHQAILLLTEAHHLLRPTLLIAGLLGAIADLAGAGCPLPMTGRTQWHDCAR